MEARAATTADLAKVFRNLAERIEREYANAGVRKAEVKHKFFLAPMKSGNAHALMDNDRPLAIIAWSVRDGLLVTSFAAVEEFFSARYVRFCKRHIRTIQRQHGNLPVVAVSFSDHHATPAWFKAIGFKDGVPQQNAILYVLEPMPL